MKRIGERFRQKLGIHAPGAGKAAQEWVPTSNKRNEAMEQEVRRFAQSLKQLHKALQDVDVAVNGSINTVRTVLLTPLPHAFDELPSGQVTPLEPEERLLGQNVNMDALQASGTEMHTRLQHEVLLPLEQWLSEYRNAKIQNKKCEALRLDLDEKRRSTLALHERLEKQRAINHKDLEATGAKVQSEEDKLARLAQKYAEKEGEVFNSFLRLIRDSSVLRDYAALALAIVQRSFTSAYTSFDLATPVVAPALPAPAALPSLAETADKTMRRSENGTIVPVGHPPLSSSPTGGGVKSVSSYRGVQSSNDGSYGVAPSPPSPNADRALPMPHMTVVPVPVYVQTHAPPPLVSVNGSVVRSSDGGQQVPSWYAEHMAKGNGPNGSVSHVAASESDSDGGAANPFHTPPDSSNNAK